MPDLPFRRPPAELARRMTWEAVKWSVLMLWIGTISTLVVIVAHVPLWFAAVILAFWLAVFVRYWPTDDEEPDR